MKTKQPALLVYRYVFKLTVVCSMATFAFTSCNNQQKRVQSINDLKIYVSQHRDSVDYYANTDWAQMDSEFMVKKDKLDNESGNMTQDMRDSLDAIGVSWNNFKADYTLKQGEKAKISEMDTLRNSLTLEGVRNDFTDLAAKNVLKQYERFVNVVNENKDKYTQQQWLVINISWKALNGRKKEVEKNLVAGDDAKILKLKVEYTAMKATNRPEAKGE